MVGEILGKERVVTFCSPMIRSQSFSEPVSLNHDLPKCFSVPFSSPLAETEWLEWAGIVYFPSPGGSSPDKIVSL